MVQFACARHLFVAIAVVIALSGCQTTRNGLFASTVAVELPRDAANAISVDLAASLGDRIGPGEATLRIEGTDTQFGRSLEAALRQHGIAIADHETEAVDATPLAYVVEEFEESVLVRLSTPQFDLTRIYRPDNDGAEPLGAMSLIERPGAAS